MVLIFNWIKQIKGGKRMRYDVLSIFLAILIYLIIIEISLIRVLKNSKLKENDR